MKRTAFVMLAVLLSTAFAQWLETTINLPDSLGGVIHPFSIAWDSVHNKYFVGAGGGVLVIDGATNRRAAVIDGVPESYAVMANPVNGRVYVTDYWMGAVLVVDGATNAPLDTVVVGAGPVAVCLNRAANRVYTANADEGSVTVIDGATNDVLATVTVGSFPGALCHNTTNNKVYCANSGSDNVT
ncbi:hypothetical protein FJY69_07570, partial [candidate division WOR-3 bacterium]|nr:hypothetical protein [candidate division WOR-3 bacterium]